MGSSKGDVVTGYKYYLGMHMVVCYGPIDSISNIYVGDRLIHSTPINASTEDVNINKPEIFGGDEREGGIDGNMDVLFGGSTQTKNTYLVNKLGATVPAFKDVVSIILKKMHLTSNNPYIKNWSYKLVRQLNRTDGQTQWNSANAAVGDGMNPAHIIYECLTNADWGMGYTSGYIDNTSFTSAASTLKIENFGLSFYWANSTKLDQFIRTVLEHIDGVLYLDQFTGKFVLKLIRNDYVVANLPSFDESNSDLIESKDNAWGETINQVTVTFTDLSLRGKSNSVTVHDLGNINIQQGVVPKKKVYSGVTDATLAVKLATRDLTVLASPLNSLKFKTNRTAWNLNLGDAFKWSWSKDSIVNRVYRVVHVDTGDPKSGIITISAVEDIFSKSVNNFISSQPSLWVSPNTEPVPLTYQMAWSMGYWDLANRLASELAALTTGSAYLMVYGSADVPDLLSYKINVSPDGLNTYVEDGRGGPAPYCEVAAPINKVITTITYNNDYNTDVVNVGLQRYLRINDELMRIDSIDTVLKQITVGRAVLDSVPATHVIGDVIHFVSEFGGIENTIERTNNEALDIKLLPRTTLGVLDLATAVHMDLTLDNRLNRPYPAAHLLIDGQYYPASVANWIVPISWSGRNRLLDTADLVDDSNAASTVEENNTIYTITVYDDTPTLLESAQVAAPTRSYDFSNVIHQASVMTITVTASRDGVTSWQSPSVTVSNAATGFPTPYGEPHFIHYDYVLSEYEANLFGLGTTSNERFAVIAVHPGSVTGGQFVKSGNYIGYQLTATDAGNTTHSTVDSTTKFVGYGTLAYRIYNTNTTTTLTEPSDPNVLIIGYPLIIPDGPGPTVQDPYFGYMEGEWLKITAISTLTDGIGYSLTVVRGIFDTQPNLKSYYGKKLFIIPNLSEYVAIHDTDYNHISGDILHYILPYDGIGITTTDQTTESTFTPYDRRDLPQNPGNIKINGTGLFDGWPIVYNSMTIEWNTRNRTDIDSTGYLEDVDIVPEDNNSYDIALYNLNGNTLVESFSAGVSPEVKTVTVTAGLYELRLNSDVSTKNAISTYNIPYVIGISPSIVLTHYDSQTDKLNGIYDNGTSIVKYIEDAADSGIMQENTTTSYGYFTDPDQLFFVTNKWYGVGIGASSQYYATDLLISVGTDSSDIDTFTPMASGNLISIKNKRFYRENGTFWCTGNKSTYSSDYNGDFHIYSSTDFINWTFQGSVSATMHDFICKGFFYDTTNARYVLFGYKTTGFPGAQSTPYLYYTTNFSTYTEISTFRTAIGGTDQAPTMVRYDGTNTYVIGTQNFSYFIVVSNDNNATWTDVTAQCKAEGINSPYYNVHISNANVIVIGGEFVYYSTDSGANFNTVALDRKIGGSKSLNTHYDDRSFLCSTGDLIISRAGSSFYDPTQNKIDQSKCRSYFRSNDGGVTWIEINNYSGIKSIPRESTQVVSASSEYFVGSTDLAYDGTYDSYPYFWRSSANTFSNGLPVGTEWYQIDFGVAKQVDYIEFFVTNCSPVRIEVFTSTTGAFAGEEISGGVINNIVTHQNAAIVLNTGKLTVPTPASARYFRFNILEVGSGDNTPLTECYINEVIYYTTL